MIAMASLCNSEARVIKKQWGKNVGVSNSKIKSNFSMEFIPTKQSVIDMGYSLIEHVS